MAKPNTRIESSTKMIWTQTTFQVERKKGSSKRSLSLRIQSVAHAADGLEKRVVLAVVIELLPQVLHMHVKHVAECWEIEAPHMVKDSLAFHRLVGVAHEEF